MVFVTGWRFGQRPGAGGGRHSEWMPMLGVKVYDHDRGSRDRGWQLAAESAAEAWPVDPMSYESLLLPPGDAVRGGPAWEDAAALREP